VLVLGSTFTCALPMLLRGSAFTAAPPAPLNPPLDAPLLAWYPLAPPAPLVPLLRPIDANLLLEALTSGPPTRSSRSKSSDSSGFAVSWGAADDGSGFTATAALEAELVTAAGSVRSFLAGGAELALSVEGCLLPVAAELQSIISTNHVRQRSNNAG
jgi:hypothetical protein